MYGTIATLSIDPSNVEALGKMLQDWNKAEGASDIGFVGGYLLKLTPIPQWPK